MHTCVCIHVCMHTGARGLPEQPVRGAQVPSLYSRAAPGALQRLPRPHAHHSTGQSGGGDAARGSDVPEPGAGSGGFRGGHGVAGDPDWGSSTYIQDLLSYKFVDLCDNLRPLRHVREGTLINNLKTIRQGHDQSLRLLLKQNPPLVYAIQMFRELACHLAVQRLHHGLLFVISDYTICTRRFPQDPRSESGA